LIWRKPSNLTAIGAKGWRRAKGDANASASHKGSYFQRSIRTAGEALAKKIKMALVILYTTDPVQQDVYVQAATLKADICSKDGNIG